MAIFVQQELIQTQTLKVNRLENFLYNSDGEPSGPRDFPLCISLIVEFVSATENSFSKSLARSRLPEGSSRSLKMFFKFSRLADDSVDL